MKMAARVPALKSVLGAGRHAGAVPPACRLQPLRSASFATLSRTVNRQQCRPVLWPCVHRKSSMSLSAGFSRYMSTDSAPKTWSTVDLLLPALGLAVISGGMLVYMRLENQADKKAVESMPIIEGNPIVYLDITDNDGIVGRIVIQLLANVCPKGAENFRQLCTMAQGYGYRSSPIHTVEKSRRVFAGDFFGTGDSGFSIYGDAFEDEGLAMLKHCGPGVVGYRNVGPDTNNSQFYITFRRLPELDGRSMVVGYVLEGFDVLEELDKAADTSGGRFGKSHSFRIGASGQLDAASYVHPLDRKPEDLTLVQKRIESSLFGKGALQEAGSTGLMPDRPSFGESSVEGPNA